MVSKLELLLGFVSLHFYFLNIVLYFTSALESWEETRKLNV